MKLLFLSNVFPNPFQPTKGTFNRELIRALADRHDVRIVSPVSWIDEWRARRRGALPLGGDRLATLDGVSAYYPRYYYPPKVLRRFYGWFLRWSVQSLLERLLKIQRPEAVLAYWAHPDGEVAVRAAHAIGVPAVVMVGGSDVLLLARERSRRRCILRVLHQANAIVTTSQHLKTHITEMGVCPDKIHVVSRGVDPARFCPGDKSEARRRLGIPEQVPMLLWVGRMVPVKGLDVLLQASSLLRGQSLVFRLYLVGDGVLRSALEEECRARGLADVVSFLGSVLPEDLGDWYRAADLTVLPSRSEGVPNVLRESAACGTPFVASRVGGIPEIAEEPPDRLVPPEDPGALAQAITLSLREGKAAQSLHRHSASWAEAAEGLNRILEALVSTGKKALVGECVRAVSE
jgi:glycosyltransferase involved in cell wall biosynthesis